MIIIAGYFIVSEADRAKAIAAFGDFIIRARAFEGCVDFAISPDPIDSRRINNIEIWTSQEAFERWSAVANPPLDAVKITEDHMVRYEAASQGAPG